MNVITRGVKNALRSPLRSGAIVLMLAISIGLILCMLVTRTSVSEKIEEVKASAGTAITISPAGVQGLAGGGDPLTSEQVTAIENTDHIISVVSSLSDQLGTDDTDLEASLELGSFGQRQQRFDSGSDSGTSTDALPDSDTEQPSMTPRTTVTGTTDPNSISTSDSSLSISSGQTIDGTSNALVALVGTDLAEKNDLSIGDTFTAYGSTITVQGIFTTDNTFTDSGIIIPLATLQNLTDQTEAVSSVTATVDSSDNVEATVSSLESVLGDDADITSQLEQAETTAASLESISSLTLAGVIGATVAGAVIVLLAMIMVVRERRREIGVIKAIGGTNRKVIGQFVTEALTLTVIGALVGLVLGVLASQPITTALVNSNNSSSQTQSNNQPSGPGDRQTTAPGSSEGAAQAAPGAQMSAGLTNVTSSVTPQVFIIAIGITIFIAIVGSAVPAWFIAKIRPAEVLRTE